MDIHDLIVVIISVASTRAYLWVKERRRGFFKWSCPECKDGNIFNVRTNSANGLKKLILSHQQVHNREINNGFR